MKTTTITIVSDDEGFAPIINRWKRAVENLRTAKAGDWKTKPMSLDNHYVIRTDIPIPAVAMNRIRQGHIPREMEDKWFMYYADGIIHYHRSWTGYNIFNAYCEKREEGYAITKIEVDTEEYKSSPDRAKEALDNFLKLLARQCDVCMDYPESIRVHGDAEIEITKPKEKTGLSLKEQFHLYMASKRSESSAKAYISTLDNPVRRFIHDIVDSEADSIFSFTTVEDVKACIKKLNASTVYVKTNESKHRIMSAALSNYLKFMEQQ